MICPSHSFPKRRLYHRLVRASASSRPDFPVRDRVPQPHAQRGAARVPERAPHRAGAVHRRAERGGQVLPELRPGVRRQSGAVVQVPRVHAADRAATVRVRSRDVSRYLPCPSRRRRLPFESSANTPLQRPRQRPLAPVRERVHDVRVQRLEAPRGGRDPGRRGQERGKVRAGDGRALDGEDEHRLVTEALRESLHGVGRLPRHGFAGDGGGEGDAGGVRRGRDGDHADVRLGREVPPAPEPRVLFSRVFSSRRRVRGPGGSAAGRANGPAGRVEPRAQFQSRFRVQPQIQPAFQPRHVSHVVGGVVTPTHRHQVHVAHPGASFPPRHAPARVHPDHRGLRRVLHRGRELLIAVERLRHDRRRVSRRGPPLRRPLRGSAPPLRPGAGLRPTAPSPHRAALRPDRAGRVEPQRDADGSDRARGLQQPQRA
mmetsp:Transcript_6941/g.28751  ORF Transcript_6941/g.28751 Transcript_6941/m.28751 type:complete len:429 (-) Transcript_6941:35-1321(-)